MPAHEVVEVCGARAQRLSEPRLFLDRIHGEVDGSDAGVGEPVRDFWSQKPRVRRQVHPEIFLRRVVDHLVNEVRANGIRTSAGHPLKSIYSAASARESSGPRSASNSRPAGRA